MLTLGGNNGTTNVTRAADTLAKVETCKNCPHLRQWSAELHARRVRKFSTTLRLFPNGSRQMSARDDFRAAASRATRSFVVEPPVDHRVAHDVGAPAQPQLAHRVRLVDFHRLDTDVQSRRDVLVAVSDRDQPQDLDLAIGGARRAGAPAWIARRID